jgi:hypothetical protein
MADTGGSRKTKSVTVSTSNAAASNAASNAVSNAASNVAANAAATVQKANTVKASPPEQKNSASANVPPTPSKPKSDLQPVSRTTAEKELTFDSLGGYSFDVASDNTVAFDARPVVRFADGTTDVYSQPPATKQHIPLKPEQAFTSADATAAFANNLFQSQFGDVSTDPGDDLLPKYTTSDMADALSMYDNIELSQEDLIDLSTQCQGVSTVMQSGSKPIDIRGSIGAPRGVNTGPWLQNSVNGVTDVRGIC